MLAFKCLHSNVFRAIRPKWVHDTIYIYKKAVVNIKIVKWEGKSPKKKRDNGNQKFLGFCFS